MWNITQIILKSEGNKLFHCKYKLPKLTKEMVKYLDIKVILEDRREAIKHQLFKKKTRLRCFPVQLYITFKTLKTPIFFKLIPFLGKKKFSSTLLGSSGWSKN